MKFLKHYLLATKLFVSFFLTVVLSFFLFEATAFSEDQWGLSLEPIELPPIIIIRTPKRFDSDAGQVVENFDVYSEEEIENFPAASLDEAIKYMPGVDISVNSQFGQSGSLSIHGSDSRQVLVLVDGIPFNTQLSGQANPAIIPLDYFDHIEVIKGASSSAWGSSLGGVINVITKDAGDTDIPHGEFQSTFAEFSSTKNSLQLSGKVAELGYFISGSYFETDGIKSRSDVQDNEFFGKVAFPASDNVKLTGVFGYSGAYVHAGVNSNGRWYSFPYISRYGKLDMDYQESDCHFNIAYKYNDQDVIGDSYTASTGALLNSSVSHNVYHGISLTASFNFIEDNVMVFGSDFDWHELKSNIYLSESKDINMQAPYLNYTFKWNNWDFIPGVRYDHNQQFGSQTSPSMGIIYHFKDERNTRIRAKVSRAFNAPPLLWIYNDNPALYVGPNPDLVAERATVYEVGVDSRVFSKLNAKLDLFSADVKDALARIFDGGVFKYDNFKKFRRQGVELSLDYDINENISLCATGAFTDVENKETGETVRDADIARQRFSLSGNYHNKKGFSFSLYGRYNRWSSQPDEANDRKVILDAKFRQELKNVKGDVDLEIFLNIYNVTNSKYWSDPDYPLPQRYFEGGFSFKF